MPTGACFVPSVRLNVHRSSSPLHSTRHTPLCTLAPNTPTKTKHGSGKPKSNSTFRVLPENLPKPERPPKPPVHWSLPFFGFYLEKWLRVSSEPHEKRQRYGRIYTSSFFIDKRTYISDYQAVVEASRNDDVFRSRGSFDVFTKLFGDDNMISNDFDTHRVARNAVSPAFAPAIIPQYMQCILARTRITWDHVANMHANNEPIRFESVFRQHYVSIVVEMTTGLDMDGEYGERIPELFQNFLFAFFTPEYGPVWTSAMKSRDGLMQILGDVVRRNLRERADIIDKLRKYGDDIMKLGVKDIDVGEIDILLVSMAASSLSTQPGASIDEKVVESLCRTTLLLWLAGYTTSAAASMALSFEMGMDDTIATRLIAEQDDTVAAANGDKTVTYQQVMSGMPLLDSFILELLRLNPVVANISRKVAKDIEILGYYLPKDSLVFLDVAGLQRDPDLYPDPNNIVLDRFVREDGKPKPPPILSFGAPGSPHYCVGAALAKLMIKSTFGLLLREYSYTLDKNQTREYRNVPEVSPKSGVIVESFQKRG